MRKAGLRLNSIFVILAAMLLLVSGGSVWAAPEYTMKLGHATANDAQDEVAKLFAKEVEQLS